MASPRGSRTGFSWRSWVPRGAGEQVVAAGESRAPGGRLRDGKLAVGAASWPRAICLAGPRRAVLQPRQGFDGDCAPEADKRAFIFDRLQGRRKGTATARCNVAAGLALGEPPRAERVVVLVDQFEEVFTLCQDEAERQAFIANLLHAATVTGGRTIVLLAMRADFYPRCAVYANLAAALSSDRQMLVGPMTDEELRRAIERCRRSWRAWSPSRAWWSCW